MNLINNKCFDNKIQNDVIQNFKYVIKKENLKDDLYSILKKNKISKKNPFLLIINKNKKIKLTKLLGHGQEAMVFEINSDDDKVLKTYKYSVLFNAELLQMDHPNVEKFYNMFKFNNKYSISLSEKLDIDLFNFYTKDSRTFEKIFNDLFQGLKYIHSFNFLHIDLQETNVMYSSKTNNYKIIDIAFMEHFDNFSKKSIGFNFYITPLLYFKDNSKWSFEVDYFQLGLLLYNLWNNHDLWINIQIKSNDDANKNNYTQALNLINSINTKDNNQNFFIQKLLLYCGSNYIKNVSELDFFYNFTSNIIYLIKNEQ